MMIAPEDQDSLDDLMRFLAAHGARSLDQSDLAAILPLDESCYALDSDGRVAGIKYGGPPRPQEFLERALRFPKLQRLVIASGTEALTIPAAIAGLRHLRFLWLSGNVKRIPSELLTLDLPILVSPMRDQRTDTNPRLLQLNTLINQLYKSGRRSKGRQSEKPPEGDREEVMHGVLSETDLRGIFMVRSRLRESSLEISGVFLQSSTELEDPPIEIAVKGHDAIVQYFRDRQTGDLPLNEVKVILVGHGSSGKTSLVRRLFGDTFNEHEPQTHGINIRSLGVTTDDGEQIKAHFWDFGGQEIMHATHQFFLSKRSLYILVLDGRKEEDPEYWLQHIESFGGDSPIMVVMNKIDENPSFDVNRRFLRNKYTGITDFFRLSCASRAGVDGFMSRLNQELARVQILQTRWPRSWFRVKERLEGLGSTHISVGQYNDICRVEGVHDQAGQDTLVDFLNDLGVVLHFKELELLDTHVLDPRWVTEGVYRIINSELLASQRGTLNFRQLPEVLKPPPGAKFTYPTDKHRYLIELMLKFELCYRLNGTTVLVPDLLDIQEPELEARDSEALRFVFEYAYLPKSVMPRFIVRVHADIKGSKRWRTGVELEDPSLGRGLLCLRTKKRRGSMSS